MKTTFTNHITINNPMTGSEVVTAKVTLEEAEEFEKAFAIVNFWQALLLEQCSIITEDGDPSEWHVGGYRVNKQDCTISAEVSFSMY